jgi:hypothetical protein
VSVQKDINELVAKAEEQGAKVEDRGNKVLVYCPDGETIVTIHKTTSDQRAVKNVRSRLRRGGVDV